MKYLKIIFVFNFFVLNSCENIVNNCEIESKANAGKDKETYVGSYIVLDPSQSTLSIGETIKLVEWIPNPNNPGEVILFANSTLKEVNIVGFVTAGTYKFTLKISCNNGSEYSDDVIISVKPRQASVVDDVKLEIQVRFLLNLKKGDLIREQLFNVDSLFAKVPFLYSNKINGLIGIENCANLTYLSLGLQNITDLSPISNLSKLEYLNFNQNYTIEDISPIYNLKNLKTLFLYSNPISDIGGLGNLTKLKYLDLLFTQISDINSISSLVNLEILYLGSGESTINDITSIENLIKLRHLHFTGSGITNILPLENLTNLELLDLSYNNLSEITSVSKMKKLIRLYIRRNKVEDISGIKNLENLDFLDAADNKIKNISELENLPNIHLIGLSNNEIEDLAPLVNNQHLGKGVYLYIGGNPLNDISINEHIPALIERGVTVYGL